MDERPEPSSRSAAGGGADEDLALLLRDAGRRPGVPTEDLAAIRQAFDAEWQRTTSPRHGASRSGAHAGRARPWVLAAAAVLLLVAAAGTWWASRTAAPPATMTVARVETIAGAATLPEPGGGVAAVAPLVTGAEIPAGAWIETASAAEAGTAGRLALRLVAGASLRIDEGSRVRLHSGDVVELARGAVYLDSATDAGPFDVRTPLGIVRDIGTQFEVRMLDEDGGSLRVRVRRGEVSVRPPGLELAVLAGEQLLLGADGSSQRAVVSAHGDAWQWVLGLAPPFELEGRTVAELLDWVSRETGWQVRFADAEVERVARETPFEGAATVRVAGAAATRLLPAAGLAAHLNEGSLLISRAP